MADLFPTARFGFMQQEVDIERQTISGGMALSGAEDKISADGGGRVFAEFSNGALVDRATVLAWRAMLGVLEEGATAVIVPFCDPRHQPYSGVHRVTYGDDTTHSDGSEFVGGDSFGYASAAGALRATSLAFSGSFLQPLIGGEWFTVEHPTKGPRAYKVIAIDADTSTLTFRPPLREAIASGTELDFANPRCLMVQDGRTSSSLENRRQTTAAIRFVEKP